MCYVTYSTVKNDRFGLHFCLSWGRPCDYHTICYIDGKTIQCLQTSCSMYPSISTVFLVIKTTSVKNSRFDVPQPTFLFPLETPMRLSCNMLHRWKDNSMLAKPLAACTYLSSFFNSFRVIRCLSQFVSPKIAIFTTFLFPLGTPLGQSR